MAAPFASLERRVNEAIFRRCPNAKGLVSGIPVYGMFSMASSVASVGIGMSDSAPEFTIPDAGFASDLTGESVVIYAEDEVTIRGTFYVAAHEPDGTGVSRLLLERA